MELILILIIGILGIKLAKKERRDPPDYMKKHRKSNDSPGKRPDYQSTYQNQQSEWKWDENRKLWVHPDSEKDTTRRQTETYNYEAPKTDTSSYSYKKSDIIQDFYTAPEPEPQPAPEQPKTENVYGPDYTNSYQARLLLTKNEYREFHKLRKYAEARNLYICPKVRLLDIIEPRRGEGYWSLMGKVQSKHVDFVITDQDLHIKAVVELDDSSHDRPERVERDMFVDQILTSVGYKIIHTRCITEDTLKGL